MKKFTVSAILLSSFFASSLRGDEAFARHDANRDGTVTFAELLRSKRFESDRMQDRIEPVAVEEQTGIDLFAIDSAASSGLMGQLSPVDFGLQVLGAIERLDTDADGAVSETEYAFALAAWKEQHAAY